MPRNLDLTALRSFVTVAEVGGVTRAAGQLHLTQSAVSMQLKRLEESMGLSLLDRSGRGIALTQQGELLLSYAKRLLALNDEAWGRLTSDDFEDTIVLGVPHDIVYPHIPKVLKRFAAEFPRVKVQLVSSYTLDLKQKLEQGKADLILGTEVNCPQGAVSVGSACLNWYCAQDGRVWKKQPLALAYENRCLFGQFAIEALDNASITWELVVDTNHAKTVEASVSADLAIHACLCGTQSADWDVVPDEAGLPALPEFQITMQKGGSANPILTDRLADMIASAYAHQAMPTRSQHLQAI
ncbi:MAG: LysR family transcriptional regulator [Amylibacter sp.]|nr:LysR family transcriptional regulator [Amylibacter sp.]